MFSQLTDTVYNFINQIPFDTLVAYVWGSYGVIFLLTLGLTLFSDRIKRAGKRPFLCLTNAYSGVTLALFTMHCELVPSVAAAALFWTAGYILYGLICLCSLKKREPEPKHLRQAAVTVPAEPPTVKPPPERPAPAPQPTVKNSVRLEHAVSVTDKLLTKNLSKTDRQELEKLKNTLAVLQIKGTLTPTETEILNDNFNALLKLMAKYNV